MTKVFIDGEAGTTGLRIHDRLAGRADIELLSVPYELRKDPVARAEALNSVDIAFLCLPDAAAIEAVALVENPNTVVIDTSTAHRTAPGWTYGFPEVGGLRERIVASKRIANPGCHASGFIALVAPLVAAGVVRADAQLSATSLTGYSGGGKKTIAQYEQGATCVEGSGVDGATSSAVIPEDGLLQAPRLYALGQTHKHLPEMVKVCGLENAPVFCPVIAPYYAGMEVIVPLTSRDLSQGCDLVAVADAYARAYAPGSGLVRFEPAADESGFMSAAAFSGRDDMQVAVVGNDERMTLVARFDNLGKGASGAAIQNMNIVLGAEESCGLNIG